jgi:hypothetical protein
MKTSMDVSASLQRLLLLVGLLALAASASPLIGTTSGSAQDAPSIGLDADPAGNTANSLGPIDSCVSVKKGDTFQVDIYVADVVDLSAWEVLFRYDPTLVKIVDRDTQMFLAVSPGSDVFDASEPLPDGGGLYRLAAVDLAIPHSPDSGSGVLARLTLQAVAGGVSPVEIARIDRDGNGTTDAGPLLTDPAGKPIAPSDAGGFFAGPIANAAIAVDSSCETITPVPSPTTAATPPPAESPTPEASPEPALTSSPTATTPVPASPTTTAVVTRTPTPTTTATSTPSPTGNGGDDGGPPWLIVGLAIGLVGALVLIAGGALLLRARRGRAG